MKTRKYDIANYLDSASDIKEGLKVALEEQDWNFFEAIIRAVPKSKAVKHTKENGNHMDLTKEIQPGEELSFKQVLSILHSIGLTLQVSEKR